MPCKEMEKSGGGEKEDMRDGEEMGRGIATLAERFNLPLIDSPPLPRLPSHSMPGRRKLQPCKGTQSDP